MFRLASSLADLLTVSSSLAAGRLVPDSTLRRLGPEAGGSTTFCTYEMRCSWSGRRRLRDCDAASGCDATTAGPAQITNTAFTVKCQDDKSGTRSTKYLTTHTHPFNSPFYGTTRVSWYWRNILRQSYANAKVTINLRQMSNLHNILRWTQGFSRIHFTCKIVKSSETVFVN